MASGSDGVQCCAGLAKPDRTTVKAVPVSHSI